MWEERKKKLETQNSIFLHCGASPQTNSGDRIINFKGKIFEEQLFLVTLGGQISGITPAFKKIMCDIKARRQII